MLQFYKNRLSEPALLIYNIIKNNRLVSVVVNLQGEVVNQFPVPIAAVNNGNGKIVSYDFYKLKWLRRGYHYAPDFEPNDKIQDNLILYDPVKSEETQLISLSKCQREFFRPSMRGAEHFFQHCMFSPEGDKLAFLHRWRESNGNIHSHLIILSLITGKILNTTQSSRCTHFTWVDNFNLVLFTSKQNSATQLRQFISNTWLETLALKLYRKIQQSSKHGKPMLQMDNYFRYDIRKSELCSFTALQHTDGHPHNLDNQVLITDTYPSLMKHKSCCFWIRMMER